MQQIDTCKKILTPTPLKNIMVHPDNAILDNK